TYQAYTDSTNVQFGTGTLAGTIGPTSTDQPPITGFGPATQPFSMTAVETVQAGPGALLIGDILVIMNKPPLALACSSNMSRQGVAYSSSLTASGGVPSYTFSIVPGSGSLPGGLSLNASNGLISGTPTGYGIFNFTA